MNSGSCRPILILVMVALASACGGAKGATGGLDAGFSASDSPTLDQPPADDRTPGIDRSATACTFDRDCDDGVACTDDRCTAGLCVRALDDARCDDRIACTDDTCAATGCRNTAVPARCLGGQLCDPRMGCTGGRVCASDRDCADSEPCTVNEHCDPATRVCRTDTLDGDGDHHAPRVCGGDDCDDSNPTSFLGADERCNGVDDDCDGVVDGVAATRACAALGTGLTCVGGACACETRGQVLCSGACRDLTSDGAHCGSCGSACGSMARCSSGRCECQPGATTCSGACVNLTTDSTHCGSCTNACPMGSVCTAGACACTGTGSLCGGRCVDLRTDRANCGRCDSACGPSATCVAGSCACSAVGLSWCAGTCSALATDPANCSRCGNVCRTGEVCLAGACTVPVIEGAACAMAASTASSRLVLGGLTAARDFAFDGHGGVAVAQGATVVLVRPAGTTPLTMVMAGEVVALRFTRNSGLVLAVFNNAGSGSGSGAIYQVAPGATAATLRYSGLRQPAGLAVDSMDRIWFSDTTMNAVYRMAGSPIGATSPQLLVTDVPSPTQLLIDIQNRYLFVARSDTNTVMRLALNPDGGAIGTAMPFVGGFSRVSGLAQDECDNVFVSDEIVDRVWRVPIIAGDAVRVVTDVRRPRSLMFGVGDPYGPRELFVLSSADGTLRAANLVARGVPLPVPVP